MCQANEEKTQLYTEERLAIDGAIKIVIRRTDNGSETSTVNTVWTDTGTAISTVNIVRTNNGTAIGNVNVVRTNNVAAIGTAKVVRTNNDTAIGTVTVGNDDPAAEKEIVGSVVNGVTDDGSPETTGAFVDVSVSAITETIVSGWWVIIDLLTLK